MLLGWSSTEALWAGYFRLRANNTSNFLLLGRIFFEGGSNGYQCWVFRSFQFRHFVCRLVLFFGKTDVLLRRIKSVWRVVAMSNLCDLYCKYVSDSDFMALAINIYICM